MGSKNFLPQYDSLGRIHIEMKLRQLEQEVIRLEKENKELLSRTLPRKDERPFEMKDRIYSAALGFGYCKSTESLVTKTLVRCCFDDFPTYGDCNILSKYLFHASDPCLKILGITPELPASTPKLAVKQRNNDKPAPSTGTEVQGDREIGR